MKFEQLNVADQRELIVKFLDVYAEWSFDKREECLQRIHFKGVDWSMPWKAVSEKAAQYLAKERVYAIRFGYLVQEMKKLGLANTYQHIMNHPIDEAMLK